MEGLKTINGPLASARSSFPQRPGKAHIIIKIGNAD